MAKVETISQSELRSLVLQNLQKNGAMHLTNSDVTRFVKALQQEVSECYAEGFKVDIFGLARIDFGYRRAIKKGTPVRNPATGENQPSAGRAASLRAKAAAGALVKKSLPTMTSKAGKAIAAAVK